MRQSWTNVFLVISLAVFGSCSRPDVRTGADHLLSDRTDLIAGKRIGLVTNHTALLSDGRHLADALASDERTTLVALFGPEHGIRGESPGGLSVDHGIDAATGVQVFSLYGTTRKPTPEMLEGIDVLLFDIQDIGARFYTYISTMSYAMEAAAEQGIPFIVLDRPNPIRGTWVEGFIREDSLRSFVGLQPIPIVHGMTVGELASLFNGEGWLEGGIKADLTVVRMSGWSRGMWYDETGLQWVKPSPNMATMRTAVVYPGTCLIEGANLSEGRGTERPFEYLGAPFVDGTLWAETLNALALPGVTFSPVTFTPKSIPGVTGRPKHEGDACKGIFVNVLDRDVYEPVRTGVFILSTARSLFPSDFRWREGAIDRLSGTTLVRTVLDRGGDPNELVDSWKEGVENFRRIREKYLLYSD